MQKFKITGMTCSACSARVEKAARSVTGVSDCSVNLLLGSMLVDGNATNEEIISAIERAGYGAEVYSEISTNTAKKVENSADSEEKSHFFVKFLTSIVFLLILMYFSMGHTMLGLALPHFFDGNPAAIALLQMLCALAVMLINYRFFTSGIKAIIRLSPNMDSLVAIGSGAAFVYSTAVLFLICQRLSYADMSGAGKLLHNMYFEAAAMILVLISVGKSLEARSKKKTTDALRSLERLAPDFANVERDGKELKIPISEIRVGDIFIVRAGEQIPCDGIIIEGSSAINESAITGESVPSEKTVGDEVIGATINTSGFIRCRAQKVGSETVLSKIIATVSDAAATKAPIARLADKVASVFVPTVIVIAIITTIVWLFLGESVGVSLSHGIAVLVISCPCSLGLATPVAIMVGSGVGAKNNILFKSATALEIAGRTKAVILDKTGTITSGNLSVTEVFPSDNTTETELLSLVLSLEEKSRHPIAISLSDYCRDKVKSLEICEFAELIGNGVTGKINGESCYGGKASFVLENTGHRDEKLLQKATELENEGNTVLFFASKSKLYGIVALCDTIKSDSKEAISKMQKMGLEVILLSGDNEVVARKVATQVGIEKYYSGVTPDGKANVVTQIRQNTNGKVAVIGDGINDAPALTTADVGIAIGTGTDIARDSADIILMRGSLTEAVNAFALCRKTLTNIKQNLFWAFFYNCIGIPVAAGVLVPIGISLSPMLGSLAMGLSSFCVVSNSLRINLFKAEKSEKAEKAAEIREKEEKKMEKTFKVDGMMCPHCEAHVKRALESIDGIEEATASHTEKTVVVRFSKDVPDETIKKVISDEGYKLF